MFNVFKELKLLKIKMRIDCNDETHLKLVTEFEKVIGKQNE